MALTPAYIPQAPTELDNVYTAFKAYVLGYGLPPMDGSNIFYGNQNRVALPVNTNEYAVITILWSVRTGTTTEQMPGTGVADDSPELYSLRTYYESRVQVDLCSDDPYWPVQRAQALETAFRSSVGVNFFKGYGISALNADSNQLQEDTFVNDSSQYVYRQIVTFNIGYWKGIDIGSAWFTDVTIDKIHDVDAFYPPQESI